MAIEPFPMLLAMLPLAAYLTLFGLIRLSGRPVVTTGGRDIFAVALAISGLVAIGPAELFFPAAAAAAFGMAIWPVLAFLYFLLVTLIILSSRPRLIVYGRNTNSVLPALLLAARSIDANATCDESSGLVELPTQKIHLRVEGIRGGDTVEVHAFEGSIAPSFWNRMALATHQELAKEEATSPRRGGTTFVIGAAMLVLITVQIFTAHEKVVQGFREWLWR